MGTETALGAGMEVRGTDGVVARYLRGSGFDRGREERREYTQTKNFGDHQGPRSETPEPVPQTVDSVSKEETTHTLPCTTSGITPPSFAWSGTFFVFSHAAL